MTRLRSPSLGLRSSSYDPTCRIQLRPNTSGYDPTRRRGKMRKAENREQQLMKSEVGLL